jgi:hypothetical protein
MFTRKIHAAFDYAAQCHAGQVRKGTQIPYLADLMAVASLVMEAASAGESAIPADIEDLVVAGLLHDAVEHCGGPPVLEDIRRRFGDRVADIVAHCTAAMPACGTDKTTWMEKRRAYLAMLAENEDYNALLVAAADKLHNTRAMLSDLRADEREGQPPEAFWQRLIADDPDADLATRVSELLWYYQELAVVMSRKAAEEAKRAPPGRLVRLAEELDGAVAAMARFAKRGGYAVKAPG